MNRYKKFFVISLLLSLIGAVSALISPVLLNLWAGEKVGISRERIFVLLAVLLATALLEIIIVIFREQFARQYNVSNFVSYMEKFLSMNYDAILSRGPANIIQRIQQAVGNMYSFMTGSYISICTSSLVLVSILIIIFRQSLIIGAIMLLIIPVNYLGYRALNKELGRRSKKLQEDSARGYQNILAYSEHVDYLKQCPDYMIFFNEIQPSVSLLYKSMADINMYAQSASQALQAVNRIVETISMAIVVYDVLNAGTNSVMMIVMAILFPIYFTHLGVVTNSNLSRQGLRVSLEFAREMESQREKDGNEILGEVKEITLSVSQMQVGDRMIDVKLESSIHPGDVVLLKGPSGIGKSTLAKALVKFRESEGIQVNGKDINVYTNESLRKRVNYLPQNIPIIKGSMRDNLSYNCNWNEEREAYVTKEPFLQTLLVKHPLDSEVLENGANLSGGEKQKIAIARILRDETDVIILDEFTSNIDKESAEEILKKVLENYCRKIVFIISHDGLAEKYATKVLDLTPGLLNEVK